MTSKVHSALVQGGGGGRGYNSNTICQDKSYQTHSQIWKKYLSHYHSPWTVKAWKGVGNYQTVPSPGQKPCCRAFKWCTSTYCSPSQLRSKVLEEESSTILDTQGLQCGIILYWFGLWMRNKCHSTTHIHVATSYTQMLYCTTTQQSYIHVYTNTCTCSG